MKFALRLSLAAALIAPLLIAAETGNARAIKLRAGVDNAMKFDVPSLQASAGETIKVVLTNASTLPKEVMGHNWVLLMKGTDPIAFATAAMGDAANGYIPEKFKDRVIAHLGVLGPNETGEVTFTAPKEPGEYPFLCSFPGHCMTGMKGVLVVKRP